MNNPIDFGMQFKEDIQTLIQTGRCRDVILLTDHLLASTVPDVFVAELHRARAQAYGGMLNLEEALVEWTRVLKILPDDAEAYVGRGTVRKATGDVIGATLDYTRAAEVRSRDPVSGRRKSVPDPGAAMWNYVTAAYAAATANRSSALSGYCGCIKNDSGHNAKCSHANTCLICGRAEADCTCAIKMDPSDARAYLYRAFVRHCRRNQDGTEADCTRAIELNPALAEAYCLRGTVYEKRGELEKAVADWTRTIQLNPQDVLAYSLRELAYEELGEAEKAQVDARRACELSAPQTPAS